MKINAHMKACSGTVNCDPAVNFLQLLNQKIVLFFINISHPV